MAQAVSDLLALLDLERIDDNLFRGSQSPTRLPRVFGGQVAAQALVAGTRTVDAAYAVHSLHSYFLQPGDPQAAIIYDVENLRDGRSFATRRVLGRQHGRPIFAMTASFHRAEPGYEHQDVMPAATPVADLSNVRHLEEFGRVDLEWPAIECRYAGSSADDLPVDPDHPGRQQVWLRAATPLPDDPQIHAAVFTYASDMTLLGAAMAPHKKERSEFGNLVATLDHSVWFHRPLRVDDWWLYDQTSPSASGGRGLVLARVFAQDGTLAATVAQEGLIRRRTR